MNGIVVRYSKMKFLVLLCILVSPAYAFELEEKVRTWTLRSGKQARAKLVDIVDDKIIIKANNKMHTYLLKEFSSVDRRYVRDVIYNLPKGKVVKYEPVFNDEKHRSFYRKHRMKSLIW